MDKPLNRIAKAILLTTLLSSPFILSGCGNADATYAAESAKSEAEKTLAIPVEVYEARQGEIASNYSTTAILEAKEEAFVVARAAGIIENIYVEEGDYVEKGQVLAQLDPSRYELSLKKARADLKGVEQELAKINKVYSKKLVSDDTYDKLSAQYEAIKATVKLAELDLKEATIVAPISGFIAERNAKVGNLTESFQRERMFHIVQQKLLQGIVYLPESELPRIRKEQKASLNVPALNNAAIPAYIERISPVVDPKTGTFKVTLRVPNEDTKLMAGMFSEVAINYDTHDNATLLPRQAIISIDNKNSVFVVEDGIAKKREVILGYEDGNTIEILSGVKNAEQVVTVGHQNLKDSAPVEVVRS
ncbi:efflux RND transporter periplasmic adaptor subunit [Alteromonas sp. ASW11-130]|uniref:efflux RND transporter periplasmic adaptor subunit n=1 Tax=Alteromonas sp. ASW11-130 TaxID=3015775 RepID=UPI002242C156|nr:efflux RND transporter periplasmic adaptor subunit [Alteromonas sp. ASW11-130]MCW8092037.1 efflux RND transporter periplasmic adaptor subunit [Alteromonas sp. ASW11-130]